MNQQDRKAVQAILDKLEDLKSQIETCGEELRTLADDEQAKFDNLSEGLQQADNGQAIETAAGQLDEAASAAEQGDASGAIDALNEIE